MNIKKAITITVMALTMATFASGLYFVSGGDFRPCNFKYTLRTTEPNQTITITPVKIYTLSNFGNATWSGPWSVKTQGEEFNYTQWDNIPYDGQVKGNCVAVEPLQYTYAEPGDHLVKIYDEKGNIYMMFFANMENLTSLYVDWASVPSSATFSKDIKFTVANNPFLKKVYFRFPYTGTEPEQTMYSLFTNLTNADECVVLNTERFTNINAAFRFNNMTNALYFPNAKFLTGACFQNSPRIPYVSIPNVTNMLGQTCNISRDANNTSISDQQIIERGWGLKALRIGDQIEHIDQNSFWRQANLKTIEFVTDEEDWIGKWNAKAFLTQFFGVASAIDGQTDTATLTQLPSSEIPNEVFSVNFGLPHPTTLKRIRRTNP